MNKSLLLSAFKATAPLLFNYIPMGMAFCLMNLAFTGSTPR